MVTRMVTRTERAWHSVEQLMVVKYYTRLASLAKRPAKKF
jgi:hypothetical protein